MHPNKHALLFLILWISGFLYGQDFEVRGRISLHNSKLENKVIQYMKDVKVTTSTNSTINSDYKGRFKLKFKSNDLNQNIKLMVEKSGFEVVNFQALEHFEIDRKHLLRLFLAKDGYLEKQQNKLLYSNQKALYTHRDHLLDILAFDNEESKIGIKELEEQLDLKIYNNLEAEEKVKTEVKNIENKLEAFSLHLATVNLDFASNMYQKAFDFYQKGNLEKTVETLEEDVLEKNLNNVIAVIEKAKEVPEKLDQVMSIRIIQLNQIKECLVLKTIALQQLFRYKDAFPNLENLSKIIAITGSSEDEEIFELLKLPDLFDKQITIIHPPKTKILKEEKIDSSGNIAIEEKNIAEEKVVPIKKNIREKPLKIEESSSGKLSINDFETALLLKERKLIFADEIVSKGESLKEKKVEIMEEKPIAISTDIPTVKKEFLVIEIPKPIKVIPKKTESIVEEPVYDNYSITTKTSLRALPTASSKVLKRLKVGTEVQVIEKVNKYWNKVIYKGKEGYVKTLLLVKEN